MEIYNEAMERIENPDLTRGRLTLGSRTIHHEAVEAREEVWHHEVIRAYPNGGKDLQRVIDVPGREAAQAWDEQIPIQIYIPYTQEELDAIEAEKNKPTMEQRLEELEGALEMILSGVTE